MNVRSPTSLRSYKGCSHNIPTKLAFAQDAGLWLYDGFVLIESLRRESPTDQVIWSLRSEDCHVNLNYVNAGSFQRSIPVAVTFVVVYFSCKTCLSSRYIFPLFTAAPYVNKLWKQIELNAVSCGSLHSKSNQKLTLMRPQASKMVMTEEILPQPTQVRSLSSFHLFTSFALDLFSLLLLRSFSNSCLGCEWWQRRTSGACGALTQLHLRPSSSC